MTLIRLVFESLCRSLIRFFDNRFVKNNDVEWYRMELDKAHMETQRVIERFLMPQNTAKEPEKENDDFIPLNNSSYKPWHIKKQELELASFRKAQDLAKQAKEAINKSKTTEQLEAELLDGTDN